MVTFMSSTLIKNAKLVSSGKEYLADLRIKDQRIDQIGTEISATDQDIIVEAEGCWLLPGMIDDQVHFREPGLTHKGNIYSESRAAVAGGITSFMEMPNVSPSTTSIKALEHKFGLASQNSAANYSFYLGATEDNLDQIKRLDPHRHCGVKVFMGASTGDLLVEHPEALDAIFAESPTLIVTHCENSPMINENFKRYVDKGIKPTIHDHPLIRNVDACYASSSYAVGLAKRYGSDLHVLHITTEKELSLFQQGKIDGKKITAEACVHHLWFSEEDYQQRGNLIKCNPAIKARSDRDAILAAVRDDVIDIVATDHAPHTWDEKNQDYNQAPAGLPLVEHALQTMLDHVQAGRLSLQKVVEKVAHNPTIRYGIPDRGYLREGYYADLVLVDPNAKTIVSHQNCRYKCEWTPFDGHTFNSKILATWVNGHQVFDGSMISDVTSAMPLTFSNR